MARSTADVQDEFETTTGNKKYVYIYVYIHIYAGTYIHTYTPTESQS